MKMNLCKKIAALAVAEAQRWEEACDKMKEDSYRDLYIDEIWVAKHKDCPRGAIGIDWHGAPGFGTYELHIGKDGKLHCRSEYMDSQDDKRFLSALLAKLAEEAVIEY